MAKTRLCSFIVALMMFGLWATAPVQAAQFTINVVDQDGTAVSGFRWLLQQDTSYAVEPGVQTADMLSIGFSRSYHPIALGTNGAALKGNTDSNSLVVGNVPNGNYYLSVLPYAGHSLGAHSRWSPTAPHRQPSQ